MISVEEGPVPREIAASPLDIAGGEDEMRLYSPERAVPNHHRRWDVNEGLKTSEPGEFRVYPLHWNCRRSRTVTRTVTLLLQRGPNSEHPRCG